MKTYLFVSTCFMRTALLSCLLLLMNNLLFAQLTQIYAESQTNTISALCVGCSIQNPQNAIGNDETSYSSLKMGVGVLGKVEQTLKFPKVSSKALYIKIGVAGGTLDSVLPNGATIETMSGNIPNNDSQLIDGEDVLIGIDDSSGTLFIQPQKPYDRIKISLGTGVLSLNSELRIYCAYQEDFTTGCSTIPSNFFYYYPFNGNLNSEGASSLPFVNTNSTALTYKDSVVCGKALSQNATIVASSSQMPSMDRKTIAFWAQVEGSLGLTVSDSYISLSKTSFSVSRPAGNPSGHISIQGNGLHHYAVAVFPVYRSPLDHTLCVLSGKTEAACSLPESEGVSVYFDGILGYEFNRRYAEQPFKEKLEISLNNATIDELLIYEHVLPADEIKNLVFSYNKLQNYAATASNLPISVMKMVPAEDVFTVSPNPTAGSITISGNILLEGAAILIKNSFGKEVFQSKLSSKTFELPATLPGGVYILSLQTTDKKMYTRKIILTR